MALEAIPARLARDGRRVLCGRVRPGVSPCPRDLGTYFGRDGSDPLAWAVELGPGYRLEVVDGSPMFVVRLSTPRGRVSHRANDRPEGLAWPVNLEADPVPAAAYRIQFSKTPEIRVRCRACATVNAIGGADLVRQYGELVERGRLTTSR